MSEIYRGKSKLPHPGPYLGIITNHLDGTFMGMLEVSLIKGLPDNSEFQSRTFPVKYLSPFYGVTSVKFEGNDSTKFDDVQKSYGMWMIPPDIGTQVLIIFIEGDPNQGYWMGCVMDMYQNHMVPGIAASKLSAITADQESKYQTSLLPVAEMHKKSRTGIAGPAVDKSFRPVHPFADRLLEQGLLLDTVRGVTTSGARRELPSQVFGISTPGPLDENGPKNKIGYSPGVIAPTSRLGGTTFVMDDGDIDGQNELVRLRTRTGHQILLHNTKDLIYIGNAKGSAWVELTSDGKIDIYAEDSISIHTEQDFNIKSNRNINLEAAGTVNIASNQSVSIEGQLDLNLSSSRDLRIDSGNQLLIKALGDVDVESGNSMHISSKTLDISSGNTKITGENLHLKASEDMFLTAENIHIKANKDGFITTEQKIHINGAPAKAAENAQAANIVILDNLYRFALPYRSTTINWQEKFYKANDLYTVMSRVPTHEPYDQHESINTQQFNSNTLDINSAIGISSEIDGGTKQSVKNIYKLPPNVLGILPKPTGNREQDNLQAFLWTIRYVVNSNKPAHFPTPQQIQQGDKYYDGYCFKFEGLIKQKDQTPHLGTIGYNENYHIDSNAINYEFPEELQTIDGVQSSISGAYAISAKTWNFISKQLDLSDWKPKNQDLAAIFLLALNNSIDDIKKGKFNEAVRKNRKTWYGFPDSNYKGLPTKSYNQLLKIYTTAGGKLA